MASEPARPVDDLTGTCVTTNDQVTRSIDVGMVPVETGRVNETDQNEPACKQSHQTNTDQEDVDKPPSSDSNGATELTGGDDNDGLDPENPDEADKFKIKKLISFATKKLFPKNDDKLPYGAIGEEGSTPNENKFRATQRKLSENKGTSTTRKHSFKKALENPVPIQNTSAEESDPGLLKSMEYRRVPDPYPCQTNIQIHPNPRSPRSRTHSDDNQYDFTNPERGYLVMIVNDHFTRQSRRDGAHWDLTKMKEVSRKLGLRVFNNGKERNLNKTETLKLLRRAQQMDHSRCDCFMFMISTHGLETANVRARGKPDHALVCADDQLIFTSSILEMFNDENCPSLKNKPKLFFIQACRGEQLDHGSDVFVAYHKRSADVTDITRLPLAYIDNEECLRSRTRGSLRSNESVDEIDTKPGPGTWDIEDPTRTRHQRSPGTSPAFLVPKIQHSTPVPTAPSRQISKIYAPTPYAICDTPSLRCDNDMLVMYAIPEGMFAWRNTDDGSWMIDYLHQVIMAHDMRRPKNFLLLLTKVSSIMSRKNTNTPLSKVMDQKKAIPVIEHKLLKDVIFQQKGAVDWIEQLKH